MREVLHIATFSSFKDFKNRTLIISEQYTSKQITDKEETKVLCGLLLAFWVFPPHSTVTGVEQCEEERERGSLAHSILMFSYHDVSDPDPAPSLPAVLDWDSVFVTVLSLTERNLQEKGFILAYDFRGLQFILEDVEAGGWPGARK